MLIIPCHSMIGMFDYSCQPKQSPEKDFVHAQRFKVLMQRPGEASNMIGPMIVYSALMKKWNKTVKKKSDS